MAMRFLIVLTLLLTLLPTSLSTAQGQQEKVPEADSPADVQPGETALLESTGKFPTKYFLRVPESYDKEKGTRIIIFMHGSNMNGLAYLRSFEAVKWCEDDLLVCPNGERGDDPYGANNFSFASANNISELTKEVLEAFNATRVYIGGHSQGGFVTYSVIMHFPDLYHGAFPMAGDCWMQNEPNLWEENPDIVAKQKKIPIAVIHGQKDPVVSYSQGEHAYNVFLASAYPKLRFFNPERLGHQFMLSPVDEALDWLDAMNGDNPEKSLKLTNEWGKQKEWGWAHQTALALLKNESIDQATKDRCEKIKRALEVEAKKAIPEITEIMGKKPAEEWIPKWNEFRRQFGATAAAKELVDSYDKKREEQREAAAKLFNDAFVHIRKKEKAEGYKLLEQLLVEAPCTYHAYYAIDWLANRDDKPKDKPFR